MNMGYCRFRNTYQDLVDCYYHWDELDEHDTDELAAQVRLLNLCKEIVETYYEEAYDE